VKLVLLRNDGSRADTLDEVELTDLRERRLWVERVLATAQHDGYPDSDLPQMICVGQDEQSKEREDREFVAHEGIWGVRYDRSTGQAALYIDDDGCYHQQCVFDSAWLRSLLSTVKRAVEHIQQHPPRKQKRP
jgi:hypothetical protein